MQWCNCDYNVSSYSNNISNIDNNLDAPPRCFSCGSRVSNETIIMLLLKETIELKEFIEILRLERVEKENEEFEEERREQQAMDKIDKQTERFHILDL